MSSKKKKNLIQQKVPSEELFLPIFLEYNHFFLLYERSSHKYFSLW